ncbi:hypothetical protein [Microbacterium sp. NPDC057650]|uniref:hypothetical protein n=1 Tax=unclassified Microbacterium TaxID=2609290 RepID=UPI00367323B0
MSDQRSVSEKSQDRRNERSLKMSADSAKATARSVDQMLRLSKDQLAASKAQVELTRAARADAEKSERFTRAMAWCSLGVAIASLGAALAALFLR